MKLTKYILVLVSVFLLLSVQLTKAQIIYGDSNVNQKATYSYVVKMGETAYSIATSHNITVEEIYKLNPETEKGIKAGQEIKLPVIKGQQLSTELENNNNANLPTHQIEAKETLFSVSQKYGTTVYELLRVNPGLSESSFNIGKVINIPTGKPTEVVDVKPSEVDAVFAKSTLIAHEVGKKETLYGISKKYDCSIDEILRVNPGVKESGLKEGMVISIPQTGNTNSLSNGSGLTRIDNMNSGIFYPRDGIIRVALLLPFKNGSKSVTKEKIEEYYEGFLLAVQKMKEQGLNAEIYTFDIGTDNDTRRLESILGTNELNDLNLIIGGISDKQVKLISHFSQMTGTNYVVPFNNKGTGVEENRYEFQIANSHSSLFPKIAKYFTNKFRDYNVIFLSDLGSDKSKKDFVKALQDELQVNGVQYKLAPTTASVLDDLNKVIDKNKKNIIVPLSHSESGLRKILDAESVISEEGTDVSLFGYPEWQTYLHTLPRLYQANTYFYSMFYLDAKSPAAQIFSDKYRQWFNKTLLIAYPKFAHMGYDTGIIFLTGLQKYGHSFAPYVNSLGINTLQSALHFEPIGEQGGYVNTGVYLVNLKADNSIEKIEIK